MVPLGWLDFVSLQAALGATTPSAGTYGEGVFPDCAAQEGTVPYEKAWAPLHPSATLLVFFTGSTGWMHIWIGSRVLTSMGSCGRFWSATCPTPLPSHRYWLRREETTSLAKAFLRVLSTWPFWPSTSKFCHLKAWLSEVHRISCRADTCKSQGSGYREVAL